MSYLKSVFSLSVLFLFSLNLSAQLADVDEGCVPLTVNFTAPGGATAGFWSFGNGATSTELNPEQIYTSPGTYTVEFRLVQGGPVQATDTVSVYPVPEPTFEGDTLSGCVPFQVNFSNTTAFDPRIDITGYNWSFGDGDNGSGENITHTYNDVGSFNVSLEMTSSMPGCRGFTKVDNYISTSEAPSIGFLPNTVSACTPPLNVTFQNTTPANPNYTYAWDFGNGETSDERTPGTITYDQNGTFDATLTVTDAIGCSKDSTILISIGNPTASFEIPDTVCVGRPVLITNLSSAGNYLWTFQGIGTSTSPQPTVLFPDEGDYDITLRVTDETGTCVSDTTIQIYAESIIADFVIDPLYTCDLPAEITFTPTATDIDSLRWTFHDGTMSSDPIGKDTILRDPSIYGINGQQVFETNLYVENARGCSAMLTKTDTVHAPNARFNVDTIMGCAPLEVTFYDSLSTSRETISTYTYIWGDGTANSTFTTSDSVKHTFTQAGEYDVVLVIENAAGCRDTSFSIQILVGAPVTADFTVDKTTICPGDTINFTGTGDSNIDAWHFTSDNGRLSHCSDEQSTGWVFDTETGVMDASLTVLHNGCPTVVEKQDLITVNGPIAKLDFQTNCTVPLEVIFADSSFDATSVSWSFGDSQTSMIPHPSHVYAQTGDYEVVLTASNAGSGCPDSRDTAMVHVRNLQANFSLKDTYCQGEMFQFDASSSVDVNAECWKGYTWFPSDSRPITTQDAAIDYMWTGIDTQNVMLIVEDINGCKDTLRDTTIVFMVAADFEFTPGRLCAPNDVQFTDLSTGNSSVKEWEWDFGDSGTSTTQNPTHTYTTPPNFDLGQNTYTVKLVVYDSLRCSDSLELPVEFYEPISTILPSDDELCVGEQMTYQATDFTNEGSFLNYSWSLNGSSLNNNTQSGTLTAGTELNVGVNTLTVNFTEDATGCMGSDSVIIRVQDFPNPEFTSPIDGNVINCAGQNVTFSATTNLSDGTYTWDMGDGRVFNDDAVFTYAYDRGTYTTTLYLASSFGCLDSFSRDYTFVAPEGTLTADQLKVCPGDEVVLGLTDTMDVSSFVINIEGNNFNDQAPLTYQFNNPGRIDVVLQTNLDIGSDICTTTDELVIEVVDLSVDFTTDKTAYCLDELVTFESITGSGVDNFFWEFDDGETSIAQNPTHSYDTEGTYNVTLTVENTDLGCSNEITKPVDVNGDLDITLTAAPQSICVGETATLTVTSPNMSPTWTYNWAPATSVISFIDSTATVAPTQTTDYTVTVRDITGCEDDASISIQVAQPLNIQPDTIMTMVKEDAAPFLLPSLPEQVSGLSIRWVASLPTNPLDTTSSILQPTVTANSDDKIEQEITYTAFIFDGCRDLAFGRTINPVRIPNIFSPSGDDTNDYFNLFFDDEDQNITVEDIVSFQVFNRWGKRVYNNETPLTGWDGMYNDKEQPSDVYIYRIELKNPDGSVSTPCEGDVTLYR